MTFLSFDFHAWIVGSAAPSYSVIASFDLFAFLFGVHLPLIGSSSNLLAGRALLDLRLAPRHLHFVLNYLGLGSFHLSDVCFG